MGFPLSIVKKVWNGILDAIAWLTQDSEKILKKKRRRELTYIRLRGSGKK